MAHPADDFKAQLRGMGINLDAIPENIRKAASEMTYQGLTDLSLKTALNECTALMSLYQEAQSRCRDCTRDDAGKVTEACGTCEREQQLVMRILTGAAHLAAITAIAMTPGSRAEREKAAIDDDCGHEDCEVHGKNRKPADPLPEGFDKF